MVAPAQFRRERTTRFGLSRIRSSSPIPSSALTPAHVASRAPRGTRGSHAPITFRARTASSTPSHLPFFPKLASVASVLPFLFPFPLPRPSSLVRLVAVNDWVVGFFILGRWLSSSEWWLLLSFVGNALHGLVSAGLDRRHPSPPCPNTSACCFMRTSWHAWISRANHFQGAYSLLYPQPPASLPQASLCSFCPPFSAMDLL